MKKKQTISIGIPAHNEEKNIKHLIQSLLEQKQRNFRLKEIIIVSDGSTDKTITLVNSIKNPLVKLIKNKIRIGQQLCQNQILDIYKAEILVLIEADTLPYNKNCLAEIVQPFLNKNNNLGLVRGITMVAQPTNFFETILFYGSHLKKKVFLHWKSGDNIYLCGGHTMRAFSRSFTSKLRWPANVPEDAYAYLYLKKLGLGLFLAKKTKLLMRNVTHLSDCLKQSRKFIGGKKALENYFPVNTLESEYHFPIFLAIRISLIEFIKHPFWLSLYLLELLLNRLITGNTSEFNALYEPYFSSKKLFIEEQL
ncbi:MAG TPA: glycosyltransferase [Candidatus Bathyarchaeia archaeon]|nr:glycosyltransferase [Candidatus Bathyarchaeia archaeon]